MAHIKYALKLCAPNKCENLFAYKFQNLILWEKLKLSLTIQKTTTHAKHLGNKHNIYPSCLAINRFNYLNYVVQINDSYHDLLINL